MRRRWWFAVLVVVTVASLGGYALASSSRTTQPVQLGHSVTSLSVIRAHLKAAVRDAVAARGIASTRRSCSSAVRRLGMIVFVASGRVELVDLATCRAAVLARGAAGDVRFSPDGRWVAYSRRVKAGLAGPVVVSVRGGRARLPLGGGILAWQWAPKDELLYGITGGGSLVAASPTGARRVVAPHLGTVYYDGPFGVSPDGRRAIVNGSRCNPLSEQLDAIDAKSGVRTVVFKRAGRFSTFAGFSGDGRWVLAWAASICSSSLAADGWPLYAVPVAGGKPVRVVSHMLLFRDFLTWCGRDLIAAAGPDRETQTGSALVKAGPPTWRQRTIQPARRLSWVSPSCAPSGHELAAAAGPNNAPVSFGHEHRSIWLLRPSGAVGRRLTQPPARDLSDEAPRFSRNGRWILFVRSRVVPKGDAAISRDTIELVPATGGSAVPIIDFTSHDFSYYDHFDWPDEIDWHQPR